MFVSPTKVVGITNRSTLTPGTGETPLTPDTEVVIVGPYLLEGVGFESLYGVVMFICIKVGISNAHKSKTYGITSQEACEVG